jgi:hypothetical protein
LNFLDGEGEVREGKDYHWEVKRRGEGEKGGAVHVGEPVNVYITDRARMRKISYVEVVKIIRW